MKSIRPGSIKNKKGMAWFLIGIMFIQNFLPFVVLATGGPSQPEFSRFEPYGATNLVNPFTGNFTYNVNVLEVPGAHGGGYALSLSYHSGISPEDEASWVGYGWTLNPGAILRDKRGFADDSNGQIVKYWNKVPANWTVSLGGRLGPEVFSFDFMDLSVNASLRYNNRMGFGYTKGLGADFAKGVISLGYNISDGELRFSAAINPGKLLEENTQKLKDALVTDPSRYAAFKLGMNHYARKISTPDAYGFFTYASTSWPTAITAYKGDSYNFNTNVLATFSPLQAGIAPGLTGSYSRQQNVNKNGVAGAADELKTFGYMYSGNAGSDDMMDYYVEKGGTYEKNDRFLGMPFSNADNFSVSGEGLSGGFRLFHKKTGHFHPNHKKSSTAIHNIGFEVEAGLNLGGGLDVGSGSHSLEVTSWKDPGNTNAYTFSPDSTLDDEPYFFRFNNDTGGSVEYQANDNFLKGDLHSLGGGAGDKAVEVNIPTQFYKEVNQGNRPERSSYIAYHTNEEMAITDPASGIKYKAYCKDLQSNQWVKRDGGASNPISKGVGEFAVFNEEGVRYAYGLPVYARNEFNLQYDLQGEGVQVENNYTAFRKVNVDNDLKMKIGEERPSPYASSYLLTEITSPDYIDRTGNGATADDFGGYTKFNYIQSYGSPGSQLKSQGNNWFKWRIPYTGLRYERNEMSDPDDDLGTATGGEREIYYMQSVETKTHIAYFVLGNTDFNTSASGNNGFHITGSGNARTDGLEAAAHFTASDDRNAKGARQLQKLERIELYAKDPSTGEAAKLLKTVNFEYDYSLCKGIPNSLSPEGGKLTLKKVWFDFDATANAKISPFIFEYNYPQSIDPSAAGFRAEGYPEIYQSFFNYGSGAIQNPGYNEFNVDAWGNHQADGISRFRRFMPWLDQAQSPIQFDPAAWHLKVIKLPSKGEIHVQYEQNTYSYVQDRSAMGMVSLSASPANASPTNDKFYINPQKIGVSSAQELLLLKSLIMHEFIDNNKKIYFKFYYKLLGLGDIDVTDGSCNGEFITGYATVKEVGNDAQGLFIRLQGFNELPKNVCRDYVQTQRAGKLVLNGNCDASDGVDGAGEPLDIVSSFAGFLVQNSTSIPGIGSPLTCSSLSLEDSYLRIPLLHPKKGGGLRVKRLLTFDEGMEPGDRSVFGKEYIYDEKDEATGRMISNGVATTEPMTIREENSLVEFMHRFHQGFIEKVVSGRDKETTEGPIGESLLPAPSVGYSKVIVKDIHKGKTNPGFTVYEYNTARDYPFDRQYSHLTDGTKSGADFTGIQSLRDYLLLPAGVINYTVHNLWVSQGFRFILNNMHGQLRTVASYGGDYADPETWMLSSKESYTYFEPGEKIPVLHDVHQAPVLESPGKEMEVVFEVKAVEDILDDINIEGDIDAGFFGPIPIPFVSVFPTLSYSEGKLRTHVTTTVVRYPALVKSVEQYADGIYHLTEHKAFSPLNGSLVVSHTTDSYNGLDLQQSTDHDGTVRNVTFPAATEYPDMGAKFYNERSMIRSEGTMVINKIPTSSGYLELSFSPASSFSEQMKRFVSGDLVAVYKQDGSLDGIYNTQVVQVNDDLSIRLFPTTVYTYDLDRTFKVSVEILRSGRNNKLNASVGNVSTYGSSIIATPTNELKNVMGAQALTFKDDWSYDPDYVRSPWPTLPQGITNPYERGEKGKWRALSSHVYKTTILPANNESLDDGSQARNYNRAGSFADFVLFNWQDINTNNTDKWIAASTVTSYTSDGAPQSTVDVLNIPQSAKFGYHHTLPYLSGTNASKDQIQFESFENVYQPSGTQLYFEDGLSASATHMPDSTVAHSGNHSFKLSASGNHLSLNPVNTFGQSYVLKVWVREDNLANSHIHIAKGSQHPRLKIETGSATLNLIKVAQTGEWSMYETILPKSITNPTLITPRLTYFLGGTSDLQSIWVDDVRVQPVEASVVAYVYDRYTHRLLAVFDDQHFGLFFQYNAEGKLMRKIAETERGRKTLSETQYNTPTINRTN